jgi:hypothetical protein
MHRRDKCEGNAKVAGPCSLGLVMHRQGNGQLSGASRIVEQDGAQLLRQRSGTGNGQNQLPLGRRIRNP